MADYEHAGRVLVAVCELEKERPESIGFTVSEITERVNRFSEEELEKARWVADKLAVEDEQRA